MARGIGAGYIQPVILFDADGNVASGGSSNIGNVVLSASPGTNIGDVGYVAEVAASGNTHAPAANTAAVVTLGAPGAGRYNVIASVEWSYDDDPTGGSLVITDGAITVFTQYITTGGPGFFQWVPPKRFGTNSAVTITLAAGGAAVTGSVNAHAWTE